MNAAQTIFQQMGGNKFSAIVGVKSMTRDVNSLTVRFAARAGNGANMVRFELTKDDSYTVTYYKLRGIDLTEVSKETGIYADMLATRFAENTGLATHL